MCTWLYGINSQFFPNLTHMKSLIFGITLFASLLLLYIPGSAQSVKKKGWIVLNSGDTLHGWFNYRNWEKNPSAISFSGDSLATEFSKYSKYDIQSAYITDLDFYQKAIVKKDARPVKLPDLLPANVDSLIVDTVLLRVLVSGSRFNLFELMDEKAHFFIQAEDGEIKELEYRVVKVTESVFTQQKIYIDQLKALVHNAQPSPELLKRIDAAAYKEKNLGAIVEEMNGLSGSVHYKAHSNAPKVTTSFFVGAGAGFSSLIFSGTNELMNGMSFTGCFVPFATIGVDIASARNLQALVLRTEISYSSAAYHAEGTRKVFPGSPEMYTTRYEVAQTNISPSFSLLYNFIRKKSFRMYAGSGIAYNFSFYGKNTYTQHNATSGTKQWDDYLDYPKGWVSLSGKLGVKINNKLEMGATGQFIGSMTNYALWGLTPKVYTAQVRYFLH